MKPLISLMIHYQALLDTLEIEFDVLARDQMILEHYSSRPNADQLKIDASQQKINQRYDDLEAMGLLLKKIPALVELSIKAAEQKKDFRIKELEDMIGQMGELEIKLIQRIQQNDSKTKARN